MSSAEISQDIQIEPQAQPEPGPDMQIARLQQLVGSGGVGIKEPTPSVTKSQAEVRTEIDNTQKRLTHLVGQWLSQGEQPRRA